MKKLYISNTHELLNVKSWGSLTDFSFSLYHHETIYLEPEMYITLAPIPKKNPSKTVRGIIFKNKGSNL